ncbi:WAT1-related protein [Panicum miliaceum]|uniref:WAT1-related protein n=1 Tax=Panicum miliaceum TaxID=4540 RepID=A0A3L6QLJ9_PANMI|nr:WAT1-related protein [Panicum miliaceum]
MAMVLVQLFQTGLVLLSKVVIGHGLCVFALVTYRSAFGTAFLLPFALICERDKWREMMNWRVSRWIIFNGFIGMERLKFATVAGSLKIVGVLASVGGTMVINLYKGNELRLWSSILQYHNNEQTEVASHHSEVHKVYPYKYWSSMATCLVGGFMTAFAGVVVRRDWDAWKLGWNLKLLTVMYSGGFATAGKYSLNSWVVGKQGPAYPPMVSPLSVVFTVVLGSILLGDSITIGRC